jgi:hypothetical protein
MGDGVLIKGKRFSMRAWADRNIVVGDRVKVIARDPQFGSDFDWQARGGSITIGERFRVKSTGKFFSARPEREGEIYMSAAAGDLSLGPGAVLITLGSLELRAQDSVTLGDGAKLTVKGDGRKVADLDVVAGDQLAISGARIKSRRGTYTAGSSLRISAAIATPFAQDLHAYQFSATEPGGTCDLRGSRLPVTATITYSCATVIPP